MWCWELTGDKGRGIVEGTVLSERWEDVFNGDIMLKATEILENGPLKMEASAVVGEDKENPIKVLRENGRGDNRNGGNVIDSVKVSVMSSGRTNTDNKLVIDNSRHGGQNMATSAHQRLQPASMLVRTKQHLRAPSAGISCMHPSCMDIGIQQLENPHNPLAPSSIYLQLTVLRNSPVPITFHGLLENSVTCY
eukprot:g37208.t1